MNGTNSQRLTIGVLIHRLDNDYSKAFLKGAAETAKEHDVNLAIFPGRSLNPQLDNKQDSAFEYQNNVIYSYVSRRSLDAAVVSAGTIGSFVSPDEFAEFLKGFGRLPIITTEAKVMDYPCVRMSGGGIKELVLHLSREHGRKHIAFVSGPRGNADAEERLSCYREALEELGMEFDPTMVAYGKFSEYCVDIVSDLLDKHSEIDAICFANDMMCKGGYKAIAKRGLKVGEDISVTGYDDSEVAVSLRPMLTTVRADASVLGAEAVREAIRLAMGTPSRDLTLSSTPVHRASCGCSSHIENTFSDGSDSLLAGAADHLLRSCFPRYDECLMTHPSVGTLRDIISFIIRTAANGSCTAEEEELTKSRFAAAAGRELFDVLPPAMLVRVIKETKKLIDGMDNACADAERLIADCLVTVSERILNMHYTDMEDVSFTHFLIGNITKDMLLFSGDEEKSYGSIVNNLYRAHIKSSCIYTYEKVYIHKQGERWALPGHLILRACHNGNELTTVRDEGLRLPSSCILRNEYTPEGRSRVMVVSPLFICEEQYGLTVCEMENEDFPYIYSINPQICTAIKLMTLVTKLETTLNDVRNANSVLSRISITDELTGINNRRGFYALSNKIIQAPENDGKKAIIIYADLDNLKKINDTYGHDDGDYAIVTAAGYLKDCLRDTDVIARIGGDEFAAFAPCTSSDMLKVIPERLEEAMNKHNLSSDKPYNVCMSVGLYEFTCSPDTEIQQYLDEADEALYERKKFKNTIVEKN